MSNALLILYVFITYKFICSYSKKSGAIYTPLYYSGISYKLIPNKREVAYKFKSSIVETSYKFKPSIVEISYKSLYTNLYQRKLSYNGLYTILKQRKPSYKVPTMLICLLMTVTTLEVGKTVSIPSSGSTVFPSLSPLSLPKQQLGRGERCREVAWLRKMFVQNCAAPASKANPKPSWSVVTGQNPNKAAHIKFGNRNTKHGCVLASWNCRMGLLDD